MATDTIVNNLVINKLTKAQYDAIDNPSDTELYLVPDEVDSTPVSGSSNCVTSGGVYLALQGKADKDTQATQGNIAVFNSSGNPVDGGKSIALTLAVFFGTIDSTSTATELTATVNGLTEIVPGTTIYIYNGVINGGSNCTLDVNNLGDFPIYRSGNENSRLGFDSGLTWQLIYNPIRVEGGCWDIQYGWYSYVNLGYYDRETNYRLIAKEDFEVVTFALHYSETELIPMWSKVNVDNLWLYPLTTWNFDPFAPIYWCATSKNYMPEGLVESTSLYTRYTCDFRNVLSSWVNNKLLFLKCIPSVDSNGKRTGRVTLAENPFVQDLPTTEDGFVYILLGITDTLLYLFRFQDFHPIYEYKSGAIRLWTNQEEHLALTSEEIDRDIIQVVTWEDPAFKLAVTNASSGGLLSIAPGDFVEGEYILPQLDSITTLPNGFPSSYSGSLTTTFISGDDLGKFTNITTVPNSAFYGCSNMTSVVIPNKVTTINYGAFYNCTSLESVTLPEGLTTIGSSAFYYCSSLESITIPDSVLYIESGGNFLNSGIKSATVGDGVTELTNGIFMYCSSLEEVTIGSGVTTISNSAFSGCSSLETINFGENVSYIGGSAFYNCTSLESVEFPSSLRTLTGSAFSGCSNLSEITLNEGLLTIGLGVFSGTNITSVVIPSTVTTIGSGCFNNSVFSLIDFGNTRTTILPKASNVYFWNNGGSTPTPTIVVPDSLVEDWKADSGWSSLASLIVSYSEYHSND